MSNQGIPGSVHLESNPRAKDADGDAAEFFRVHNQDGRLSISFDPAKTTALMLLAEVEKANFDVREISTAEPDLEEVFLSLTQKTIGL